MLHKESVRTYRDPDSDGFEHVFGCTCGERVASANLLVVLTAVRVHESGVTAAGESLDLEEW